MQSWLRLVIIIMKAAIRLQNHGCANHPYWWIVVAANRKNLKGRFIEHVGYWTPRQGVMVQRQIVLNVPRIKYWIGCGAVPTEKVQKFLALWDILPKPWYQQRTPEELAARRKPESEWTEKEKAKEERKRKRRERERLSPVNYHRREARFKGAQYSQLHKYRNKLREKIYATERENQILRELLLHNEFEKVSRVNELASSVVYDDSEELARLEGELARAKSELALLDRTFQNSTVLHRIKAMQEINRLVDRVRAAEEERRPFRKRNCVEAEGENITQHQLNKKLEYELVTKRIEQMNKDFEQLDQLHEVVTLEEYANYLQAQMPDLAPEIALQSAQEIFIERGRTAAAPLTKFDLFFEKELGEDEDSTTRDALDMDLSTMFNHRRKTVDGKIVERKLSHEEKEALAEREEKEAMEESREREKEEAMLTKSELEQRNWEELKKHNEVLKKINETKILPYLLVRPDVIVPTSRPVHPFPDFETYIPEEYYDPISTMNLDMTPISSLEPKQELEKYHQKRSYTTQAASKKNPTPTPPKPERKNMKKSKESSAVV